MNPATGSDPENSRSRNRPSLDGFGNNRQYNSGTNETGREIARPYVANKGSFSIPRQSVMQHNGTLVNNIERAYPHISSFYDSERLADAQPVDGFRRPRKGNPGTAVTRWPFLGSIRSFTSSRSTRTPRPVSPLVESETSEPQEVRFPWRPIFLHRRVLAAFAVLFAVLIAGVEVALFISDRNHGLHNANDAARYLWQYGATLIFVILAAIWARVEYQAKAAMPWINLSRGPNNADKTLLLDYVSMLEGWTVLKAIQNKDWLVAGPLTAGILLKVVIVLATALVTPSVVRISNGRVDVRIGASITNGENGLKDVASLPYITMAGLQTENMSYPGGIASRAAYQPFTTAIWDSDVLNTTVDGFLGSLDCQSASLSLDTVRYIEGSRVHLEVTAKTDGCSISQIVETTRFVPKTELVKKFLEFQPGSCSESTNLDDQRIVVMAGQTTIATDTIPNTKRGNFRINGTLTESTCLICRPKYVITKMNVMKNVTDIISISPVANAENNTIDRIHPWDIAKAQFTSFNGFREESTSYFTSARSFYSDEAVVDADEPMYAALAMRAKESGAPPDLDILQDIKELEGLAQDYYAQYSALVARFAMMDDTQTSTTSTANMVQRRLVMRRIPAHVVAGLLGVCLILIIATMLLAPRHGFLPRDPGSIIDTATLLAHSGSLLINLTDAGGAHDKLIRDRLVGSAYSTGVQGYDGGSSPNLGYFHIIDAGSSGSKKSAGRIDRSTWRQPVTLTGLIRLLFGLILATTIIAFEVSFRASERTNGFIDIDKNGAYLAWTAVPALLLLAMAMYMDSVDSWTRIIAPYTNLYHGSEFSHSVTLNLIDQWKPKAWWRALKMRDFGVLSTVSGILCAALLVVATSALFEPIPAEDSSAVPLAGRDFFADSLASSENDPVCTTCKNDTVTASLILSMNASYPQFTFEDLNLQAVSVKGLAVSNGFEVKVKLPTIRANMTCRLYLSDEISANLTQNNLRVDLPGETCRGENARRTGNVVIETATNSSESNNNAYFGVGVGKTGAAVQCSDWLYVWGQGAGSGGNDVQSISALACNESIVALEAEVVLHGPELRIDAAKPPILDESVIKNTTVAIPPLEYYQLANVSTASLLDPFFGLLTMSSSQTSLKLLGDSSKDAADQVRKAILRQHGIIRAQSLNFKSRRHLSSAGTFPEVNGRTIKSGINPDASVSQAVPTFSGSQVSRKIRLRQDEVATRILHCILGIVLLFHLCAWMFTPQTVLPRWPTSIASVGALITDGNLLGYLPRVAEWQSRHELETIFHHGEEAMEFELRWDPPRHESKYDKRTIKKGNRFGIFTKPAPEVQGEEVKMIPIGIRRVESEGEMRVHEERRVEEESLRSWRRPVVMRRGSAQGSAKAWWA